MAIEYSLETVHQLEEIFRRAAVLRPMRVGRYDPGTELNYTVKTVAPAGTGKVKLVVEAFVGGGFAGQVYRVRVLDVRSAAGGLGGVDIGGVYAIKILTPPSGLARRFRDTIYAVGFQGPFSLQVNPHAARAGAIWQKLIRRGAGVYFGSEKAVVDVLATFVDRTLGACGELSEWVDGRAWRFEVDDRLEDRRGAGKAAPDPQAGSPEYLAKRSFMDRMVKLLHEMGAAELARQYEWWTCKSQPNVLKRRESESDPAGGLVAVDFRPGLALLPFVPMSPADVKLIFKGFARGSLVQFDRGDLRRLRRFIDANSEHFTDLHEAVEELEALDQAYRDSLPDITHHHVRLLYSRRLWSAIMDGAVTGWEVRNITDRRTTAALRRNRFLTVTFYLLGLIPLAGGKFRKLLGRADYRNHYAQLFNDFGYFCRATRAHVAEKLIHWHRAGRLSSQQALFICSRPIPQQLRRFSMHLIFSALPAGVHRFFTDRRFTWEALGYIFVRPVRLYFNAEAREQWLREMLAAGQANGMLCDEDARLINSQIKEPFIRKYLKSLAVHVCTLPITQIVSVLVAIVYVLRHPELSLGQAWAAAGLILVAFQVTPISPGSLVRGLYVVYLVIRERNFKDYNIAVFLGFFKYVGYLAFPIQMTYRYPALARFMAGHWATSAVHFVPVFGERGALLEHGVFDAFYNYPLTVRRRMRRRGQLRSARKLRYWHGALCVLGGFAALSVIDLLYVRIAATVPSFWDVWYLALWPAVLAGAAAAVWAGGAQTAARIKLAAACGALIAVLHAGSNTALACVFPPIATESPQAWGVLGGALPALLWRVFAFTIAAVFGAFITEARPLSTHRTAT